MNKKTKSHNFILVGILVILTIMSCTFPNGYKGSAINLSLPKTMTGLPPAGDLIVRVSLTDDEGVISTFADQSVTESAGELSFSLPDVPLGVFDIALEVVDISDTPEIILCTASGNFTLSGPSDSVDLVAILNTSTITGTIIFGSSPQQNIIVTDSSDASNTATTDSSGNFSLVLPYSRNRSLDFSGSIPSSCTVETTTFSVSNTNLNLGTIPVFANIQFTTISGATNGWAQDGDHGSSGIYPGTIYFLGNHTAGSGFFQVYDTGNGPGVSGSVPTSQANFWISNFDAFDMKLKSFMVRNDTGSDVTLTIGTWAANPTVSTGTTLNTPDLGSEVHTALKGQWTKITLDNSYAGSSSFTIDFPDNEELYFNGFEIY